MASNKSHILIYFGCYKQNMQVIPVFFLCRIFRSCLLAEKPAIWMLEKAFLGSSGLRCFANPLGICINWVVKPIRATRSWMKSGENPIRDPQVFWPFWAPHFGSWGFGGFLPQQKFEEMKGWWNIIRIWRQMKWRVFFWFWRGSCWVWNLVWFERFERRIVPMIGISFKIMYSQPWK